MRATSMIAGMSLMLWLTVAADAADEKQPRRLEHGWQVLALAFSPDGKTLVSGSADLTARLTDVRTGKSLGVTPDPERGGHVIGVGFFDDGKGLATADARLVKTWDARTFAKRRTLEVEGAGRLMCLAVSPDGLTIVAGGSPPIAGRITMQPGLIWRWDAATGAAKPTLQQWASSGEVVSLAFSADGGTLAAGTQTGAVQLWDTKTWIEIRQLSAHGGPCWAVAFSPDGKTLATGGADHKIRLWDVGTGEPAATLDGHEHLVLSLAFAPDGKTLASGSYDKTLKLWDVAARKPRRSLDLGGWVHSLRYSPDGRTLAIGMRDKESALRLLDTSE
jgi:WD40 repeat protein